MTIHEFMTCPTCGKPVEWKDNPDRPFCSERCQLIDFGRWANEDYRVPLEETPLPETEEAPTNSQSVNEGEN